MHTKLKELDRIERKARNIMMNGSEDDACTIYGKEGKNYVAWCAAADACHDYRKAHDLLGKRGY